MFDIALPRPSWLAGIARTLDIGGVFSNSHAPMPPALLDSLALAHDLKMVRRDMDEAFDHETDSPRTRILSSHELIKVHLEMMRQEIATHERMLEIEKRLIAKRRKHYAVMLERIEGKQEEESTNSRPGEELSWAG